MSTLLEAIGGSGNHPRDPSSSGFNVCSREPTRIWGRCSGRNVERDLGIQFQREIFARTQTEPTIHPPRLIRDGVALKDFRRQGWSQPEGFHRGQRRAQFGPTNSYLDGTRRNTGGELSSLARRPQQASAGLLESTVEPESTGTAPSLRKGVKSEDEHI